MDKMSYNKLVRDRIPEIMASKGKQFEVRTLLNDEDFETALLQKVSEEAAEVRTAKGREDLLKELADLAEVVRALYALKGIDPAEVEATRLRRAEDGGAFTKRLLLLWGEKD